MAKENLFKTIESMRLQCKKLENQKQEIDKKIEGLESAISVYSGIAEEYDTYNVDFVGEAFAELITAISGRKFVYDEVTYEHYVPYNPSGSVFGPRGYMLVEEKQYIVVASEKYKEKYRNDDMYSDIDEVEQLVKAGDAIKFPVWVSSHDLTIYPCPRERFEFDIEKFGYVKDFAESLIQYCYERAISENEVTKEDINACLKEFLENYKKDHATKGPKLEKVNGEN